MVSPSEGLISSKYLQKPQSTGNNKPMTNIYKQTLVNQDFGATKRNERPPPLEGDTPSFAARGSRNSEEISFSSMFLSPVRPLNKLPKVNDPTGQQRVYSSPIASFLEKNHPLPSINGPRATKSGNGENNPRNLDSFSQRNSSAYVATEGAPEISKYEMPYNKMSNKSLLPSKPSVFSSVGSREEMNVRRSADMDIRKKNVVSGSLPMLTGIAKGPEGSKDRPDSLDMEELKYTYDIRKHIRDAEPLTVNFENPMLPQLPGSKNKEKILKEVFSLNWKKKSCA